MCKIAVKISLINVSLSFNNILKNNNMLKIKTLKTPNIIIKHWKLSIGMCHSSSADYEFDESDGIANQELTY